MNRISGSMGTRGALRTTIDEWARWLLLVGLLTMTLVLGTVVAARAGAVTNSEELGQFGSEGAGAGQVFLPRGEASDPGSPGKLYVADSGNSRVDVFSPWGNFIKAFGWGVANGQAEFQSCTATCRRGLPGSGAGQFAGEAPFSVAVDAAGNLYVLDQGNEGNHRVEKFTPSGEFDLMFGGEVDNTTKGDVCTAASLDECKAGNAGSGPGEFGDGNGLAIGENEEVLVGDAGRVQEFEPDGSFKSQFSVPGTVQGVATDPTTHDIYVILRGQDDIRRFTASGSELLPPLPVIAPKAITTDPDGNVYAIKDRSENQELGEHLPQKVVEFDTGGSEISSCCVAPVFPGESEAAEDPGRFTLTGLGTNTAGDLYVASGLAGRGSFIRGFGPPPAALEQPPAVPPDIIDQFATAVGSRTATVKAAINPNFWADTKYYVEYGVEPCTSGSCAKVPVPPGVDLGAGVVKRTVTSAAVVLANLSPSTTYHYRFVAESGGGGPVRGIGGAVGADGAESTLTTFSSSSTEPSCPENQQFRVDASAGLPDCRAYEMVSPVDKEGGDILALADVPGFENKLNQSAVDGEALTYSSYRAFGGAQGSPWTAQYIARRTAGGWESEALTGPLTGTIGFQLENEFKAFSQDLCESWLMPNAEGPQLAAGAVAGFPNIYRRENCPSRYETLTTAEPPGTVPAEYAPELQGYSADGTTAIFRVNRKLSEDARGGNVSQVYEAKNGRLDAICIFPEGTTLKTEEELPNCSAGSPGNSIFPENFGRTASVVHAMSDDGSRIYWSASAAAGSPGRIYLRVDGTTTVPVSETETTKPARFWGASPDGSRALFVVEDPGPPPLSVKNRNLYLYDAEEGTARLVASKVIGVAATSENLARIYLVSEAKLTGTSGATEGRPNLYLHEEDGTNTFIATLSALDVEEGVPSDTALRPVFHVARATPDGSRLVFVSTEELTGGNNSDAVSGEPDSEVFTYSPADGGLACASCSPAGARPTGRNVQAPANRGLLWTAATVPAGETQFYAPRALSSDGRRLFFTSYADLLPEDENGKADVYEWEAVGAAPSCKDEADPDYYPADGGCLFLISTGRSEQDSELVDSSPSGRDVFFSTEESLLPQDKGLIDIYDAREGGGLPPPSTRPTPCDPNGLAGPNCQQAQQAQSQRGPQTTAPGEGNPKPIKCKKGRRRAIRKGKEICIKREHKSKNGRHKSQNRVKKNAHKGRQAGR
jgi:DNA-binding beta-propeller fold protein YncE